jgi:membrane protease subunit HflK
VSALQSVDVGNSTVAASTGLRDSSMLTQDENIVDIRFTVQYRVNNAREYLFVNREPDGAVLRAAESAVREIVGKNTMDSVLYQQRDVLAVDLVRLIQSQLDRLQAGVLVSNVNVQSVQAPEPVQAAFDDASRAVADRERFKNEGQSYANEVLPKAQSAAVRLREEAEGYRAKVVNQAEGDASRFKRIYEEYKKAPTVTRDRLYTDTMRDIYSNATKVLVDTRAGSNLLYLPLDKLMQQTGASANPTSAASASGTPTTTSNGVADITSLPTLAPPDSRSRDSGRTRDRDGR